MDLHHLLLAGLPGALRFTPKNGHGQAAPARPKSADTVEKVSFGDGKIIPPASSARAPRTAEAGGMIFPSPNETRSEEHTSELQSHLNLVCRLLLEKKK